MSPIALSASGWRWHAHPDVWLLMLAILGVYFVAIRRFGPRKVSPGDRPVSRKQMVVFAFGVASMWFAADWPMHDIAERYLLSVHMLQHLILSFVSAPLLLMGLPDWMDRMVIRPKALFAVTKRLTKPVVALLLFNGFTVFSHWPTVMDGVLTYHPLHFVAHSVLLFVSMLMWWPVLSPIAELPRISPAAQMFYLFLQTIVPTVPASFLTFSEQSFYRVYINAPRIFGISALSDQRLAGVVMKLLGGAFLWAVIAVLFFRWSAREEAGTPDPAEWQDIEQKVNKTTFTR